MLDQRGDAVKILFQVRDEDWTVYDRVGDGFGDFGLAAAGDGARLMAEGSLGHGANHTPGTIAARLFHADPVSRRPHIGLVWEQFDAASGLAARPGDPLLVEVKPGVLGHID